MSDQDQSLRILLAPPERPIDAAFVESVRQSVVVDQRLRAARARAWRRLAWEAAASLAVLVVIASVTALPASALGDSFAPAISPGTTALLIFSIWAVVALRPASQSGA